MPSSSKRRDSCSWSSSTSRVLASRLGSRRSQQWAILWGLIWASARMSRALPVATVASLGCPAASATFLTWAQSRSFVQSSAEWPRSAGLWHARSTTNARSASSISRGLPLRAPSDRARSTPPSRYFVTHRRTLLTASPTFSATGTSVSPESRSSRIRALVTTWACAVRMRASRSSLSLSSAPSATAVFDPANPCLPSLPSVNGSIPYLQSNYFMDIILAGRGWRRRPP